MNRNINIIIVLPLPVVLSSRPEVKTAKQHVRCTTHVLVTRTYIQLHICSNRLHDSRPDSCAATGKPLRRQRGLADIGNMMIYMLA